MARRMRVCIVYDCLYPWTVGGAERWYRNLAEALVGEGHQVTYLTRRQWPAAEPPAIPGVRVVAVSPGGPLYTEDGRRRVGPPLGFGAGVFAHLILHRRAYDVVHLCAFPFFSLPAVRLALAGRPTPIGVDWLEVWSAGYWRSYVGLAGGTVGWLMQRLAARLTPRAFVFGETHGRRLAGEGVRGPLIRLAGLHPNPAAPRALLPAAEPPTVIYAGRHIPEKRVTAIPAAIAAARRRLPALRGRLLGDGPQRAEVLAAIERHGLAGAVDAPGFVAADDVEQALATALCLVLASSREGYGLVVVEAASRGTPSVVVAGPDNAATELVQEGVNGAVAPSADPEDLAAAILRVHAGGPALRARTRAWVEEHAEELSLETSLRRVLAAYGL